MRLDTARFTAKAWMRRKFARFKVIVLRRPADLCGEPYPCAHRAYSRSVNHPYAT